MNVILLILLTGFIFGPSLAFAEEYLNSIQDFSEDGFDVGSFDYLPYGERFYHYQYHPFGALSGDSFSGCYFTSDFVFSENSLSESGYVIFKFPSDTVWPGAYENSTFYVVRSPSFNFPEDNKFERIVPNKTENGDLVFEFDLDIGLNTFVANHTAFWDSQNSKIVDCPNPFDFKKQEYGYYDFVYPLKVQQNYAKMLGFAEDDFLCKPELVSILKYDGSPACVKPETKQKLIERGWAKIDNLPRTFDYVIEKDTVTYGSQYEISGGIVEDIVYNKVSNSLILSLIESEEGYLQIVIQTGLLHSHRQLPREYVVLEDDKEVVFEQFSPILLKIPFEKGTSQIEIIGINELSNESTLEITGKRIPVDVPDATSENDMYCQTNWNITPIQELDPAHIKQSVQSTIAQFGITYFLEERKIDVSENASGFVVSVSGAWDRNSVQYIMMTEDLERFGKVQGEPASCQ